MAIAARGLHDSPRRLWRSALGVCPRGLLTPLDESYAHTERGDEAVQKPEQCYIARAVKAVSAGEPLRDTYAPVDDNVHFVVHYDFRRAPNMATRT